MCKKAVKDLVPTRLGRQPFRNILEENGLTLAWLARQWPDVKYQHVINVASGRTPPSEEFKRRVAAMFERPISELFTPEALDATYRIYSNAVGPLAEEVAR